VISLGGTSLLQGSLATIGRSSAVAHVFGLRFSGLLAWLAWLFVHVLFLVGFRNRVSVLFDWAWAYATYQRTARVIFSPAGAVPSRVQTGSESDAQDENGSGSGHSRGAGPGAAAQRSDLDAVLLEG